MGWGGEVGGSGRGVGLWLSGLGGRWRCDSLLNPSAATSKVSSSAVWRPEGWWGAGWRGGGGRWGVDRCSASTYHCNNKASEASGAARGVKVRVKWVGLVLGGRARLSDEVKEKEQGKNVS